MQRYLAPTLLVGTTIPKALCVFRHQVPNMQDDYLDKLFRKQARGILKRQETVDFAFATLAYEERFDLVESWVRTLLREHFGAEVCSWADWVSDSESQSWPSWSKGHPVRTPHFLPYHDSRLVTYHFGDPSQSTAKQRDAFRQVLRSRVKRLAALVRSILIEAAAEPNA